MAARSSEAQKVADAFYNLTVLGGDVNSRQGEPAPRAGAVLTALGEFDACIRYLNTRRSTGAVIDIETEADVQDVLYLLLRPWVHDLTYESPGDKTANRYVIKDFSSSSGHFVIDAKFIRDKDHGKSISKELHDDIEMYKSHPNCDDLIFFVHDPNLWIPDQRALREAIEIERSYGTDNPKRLRCHLIIK
jgi:hypothetical protein